MNRMDLTIITVCRNAVATIARTFSSVADQDREGVRLHYFVVDGGSGDGTLDIVRDWEARGLVTRWTTGPDCGIYDAMNKGIALDPPGHVLFLNADDELKPGALQTVAEAARGNPPYLYGDAEIVRETGDSWIQRGHRLELLRFVLCNHQALWVHSDWLKKLGGFDLSVGIAADLDFMWRLVLAAGEGVHIPQVLSRFRQGGASGDGYMLSLLKIQVRNAGAIHSWCGLDANARANFLLGWCERVWASPGLPEIEQLLYILGSKTDLQQYLDGIERLILPVVLRSLASHKQGRAVLGARLLRKWERRKLGNFSWIRDHRLEPAALPS